MRTAVGVLAFIPLLAAAEAGVNEFLQRFTDEWMRFHTDLAASTRYFSGPEQDAFERRIAPSVTPEYKRAELELIRKGLAELRKFDRARMTDAQRKSAEIVAEDLQQQLEAERYEDFYFPFTQRGAHVSLPALLTVTHPVSTPRDAENYVARLGQLAARMDENIERARVLIQKKMVPPRFILEDAVSQIESFVSVPPAQNALVANFDQRMQKVQSLPSGKRAELRAEAERITAGQVYPAWKKAQALLKTMIPTASNEAGIWRLPGGADAYKFALRASTTTDMTPDEIHQLGLRMVNEIEGRMDKILRELGHTQGSVRDRLAHVRETAKVFPGTEEGRKQYIAEIERIMADAERRGSLLFDRVPKARVTARPYPEFAGPRAPSYSLPAPDGSRPGAYQFPVYGVPLTSFGLRSVVYHESIPGHHFQGAIQMEDANLPRFLRLRLFGNNSAIGEGWGLYAERLAAEDGWYEGDAVGLLGQLDASLFRAKRLVVDTGLHAQRWTRQQAIEYLGPNPAGSATAEVDRYIVGPGQACSYMIGELKIVELRERAKKELGPAFSLREFHNAVLGTGRVSLRMLEDEIVRWIQTKKG